MAMPMNSEARPPSTISMMTTTSSTAVMTLFCSSCSMMRMSFDLSCVKVTSTVAGQVFFSSSTTLRVASTVSIRLAPVRFDTSMAIAGLPLTRVIEVGSLKVGRTSATSPSVTAASPETAIGKFRMSSGVLDQRRHLDREAAGTALERAGRDQAVAGIERGDQPVERNVVALQEHRLGDDLHRLVAVAAEVGVEHAWDLLDRGLRLPREADQRALRHVAAERHDEHREEREVDLGDLRLVGVARKIALGVVDLGAHVGERRVGIEARLELEQHEAAALEGGGAHLLDVLDRFQLRLERLQDEPLGILRADAALRDVDVDDRDRDVRLRFLRNASDRRKSPPPAGRAASRGSAASG